MVVSKSTRRTAYLGTRRHHSPVLVCELVVMMGGDTDEWQLWTFEPNATLQFDASHARHP